MSVCRSASRMAATFRAAALKGDGGVMFICLNICPPLFRGPHMTSGGLGEPQRASGGLGETQRVAASLRGLQGTSEGKGVADH